MKNLTSYGGNGVGTMPAMGNGPSPEYNGLLMSIGQYFAALDIARVPHSIDRCSVANFLNGMGLDLPGEVHFWKRGMDTREAATSMETRYDAADRAVSAMADGLFNAGNGGWRDVNLGLRNPLSSVHEDARGYTESRRLAGISKN